MRRFFPLCSVPILLIVIVLIVYPWPCFSSQAESQAGPELQATLDYLLKFADEPKSVSLDENHLATLLGFVEDDTKPLGDSFSLDKRKGAVSDYYAFNVHSTLQEILHLVYNPDLPSNLLYPASLHRSHWIEVEGRNPSGGPYLYRELENLNKPLVVRGKEFVENTPDTNSGAYYAYELTRTLILARHQGRPLLISISLQPERSQVGKKGLVLGPDEDWNYIYTGEKGCTLAGLSWADSYMYYSASIIVYAEQPGPTPRMRCGIFKWIKAGWAGMNLVKPYHIRKGAERFATNFKMILESPKRPAAAELERTYRYINTLPVEQLRAKKRVYLSYLAANKQTKVAFREWLQRLGRDQNYLQRLDREDLAAFVFLEYFKSVLGKPHCTEISDFATASPQKSPS